MNVFIGKKDGSHFMAVVKWLKLKDQDRTDNLKDISLNISTRLYMAAIFNILTKGRFINFQNKFFGDKLSEATGWSNFLDSNHCS